VVSGDIRYREGRKEKRITVKRRSREKMRMKVRVFGSDTLIMLIATLRLNSLCMVCGSTVVRVSDGRFRRQLQSDDVTAEAATETKQSYFR